MMATGIQAMGLMGRRICSTGFTTWLAAGYQPSVRPSGNTDDGRGAKANRHAAQGIDDVAP